MKKAYILFGVFAVFCAVFFALSAPLVAEASYAYGNSGTEVLPENTFPNLSIGPVEQYALGGGVTQLNAWIKNNANTTQTLSVGKVACRCAEAIGWPYRSGIGQCQKYWDGASGAAECQTTPETVVLAPGASRLMTHAVTQVGGQTCGSTQLDFVLNGMVWAASFANLATDCLNSTSSTSSTSNTSINTATFTTAANTPLAVSAFGPASARPSDTITIHATIRNNGSVAASNVAIHDRVWRIPGLVLQSFTGLTGCSLGNTADNRSDLYQVNCNSVSRIEAGQQINVSFSYRIPADYPCPRPFSFDVIATGDNAPGVASSGNVSMTCNTTTNLAVSCSVNPSSVSVNQQVNFNAQATGGTGNYNYQWSVGCSGFGQNCSTAFSNSGSYTSLVTVTSGSQVAHANCQVFVDQDDNNNCNSHAYRQCSGGNVYWYNSCGQRQGVYQHCTGNQTCQNGACINDNNNNCTSHSYKQCSGNTLYWYNSCGQRQGVAQNCTGNQTCQNNSCVTVNQNQNNFTIKKTVRNLSSGNLTWFDSVNANPGDIVQFNITVTLQNQYGNNYYYNNNVIVRDSFPANLYYNNALTLDGVSNSGNIVSGLNLGSIAPGQTRTITYQAQVAPASNFSFGTTTLTNVSTITTNDPQNSSQSDSASVVVTRQGVLGTATTVPTGLTNNFFVDSFFLPLLLALLGVWAWRSGFFGTPSWFDSKKVSHTEYVAKKNLHKVIADIKAKELRV